MAGRHDRRTGGRPVHPYPRTARVNALLVEVLATALEKMSDDDERLGLLTITGVDTEVDLRHAVVYLSSLSDEAAVALEDHRIGLQAAIAKGGRMKRTPTLSFKADPAIIAATAVEDALQRMRREEG